MENKTADNSFLPECYTPVSEPFFEGRGCHNVSKLEDICEQYKEFSHQIQIKYQAASLQSSKDRERIEQLETQNKEYKRAVDSIYHRGIDLQEFVEATDKYMSSLSGELPEVKDASKDDYAFAAQVNHDEYLKSQERIKELKDERDSLSQMVLEMVGESEEQIMKEFLEFKNKKKALNL